MISDDPQAISAVLTAPSAAITEDHPGLAAAAERPADWTNEWFVYLVPDINEETQKRITKAKAWPAFMAVFSHLRKRLRRSESAARNGDDAAGRRAAQSRAGVLDDEGIRGLARSIGMTPKAMSRQLAALQAIGILAAFRPPASMTRDEATGRIIRRPCKAGRVEAAKIVLTLGDDHRRPANRQGFDRPSTPPGRTKAPKAPVRVDRTPSPDDPKGRSNTTPISPFPISLTAEPAAGETGRQAEAPGRRPTGRQGGLTAAGQERGRVGGSDPQRPPNAATEATPTPPAEGRADTQKPRGEEPAKVGHLDRPDRQDRTEVAPVGPDRSGLRRRGDDPWELTRRRLEAERAATGPADGAGMDPGLGSWLAEYRRLAGLPDPKATTVDEAADRLRKSLDELPDESRQRAADLGQTAIDLEDEAKRLADIVKRRRRQQAAESKAEAAAKAAGHRKSWHARKAKAVA
jgi:hypothetical protein